MHWLLGDVSDIVIEADVYKQANACFRNSYAALYSGLEACPGPSLGAP